LRDKDFEERVKENPYDTQVIGEVAQSWGDVIEGFNDLIGKTAKKLHTLVADDFSRAVAEADKAAGVVPPTQRRPPESAATAGDRQAPHRLPSGPLMWLEVATMLAGGRPAQDVTTLVKERGIAFDADPEALWSLEALGASDAFLQAVREARVEDYYEPDPATWADFSAEAEYTFGRVLDSRPANPVLHYGLARSLDGQEKSDAAIAEYREVLRLKPDFETARVNLGVARGRSGDLKGAITELREAVRLNPGNVLAHENLGVALDANGDLDGSIAEHREAVRLKPDSVHARVNLGLALDEMGNLDGSIIEFREAVRLAPRYARAHYALGAALGRKGDLPGGRLELQEALRLNPNHALTHYVLGNVFRLEGDLEGAATEYRQALRLQPDFPECESGLTAVSDLAGKPGAAEKESRKAVRKNPQDPFAHNALGVALLRKGDLKGANQEFRAALGLKGDYSEANLGAALIQKGEVEEGVAELREAVRLKPDLAETHFLLGQTLERKGDKAGALEAYRQAYTLAPQHPEYKAKYEELSGRE
jgi:Flp pilus assembly protein TadD